jgi:Na+-transporting methylmalonyl-CoA/oxaloacetate decarboxylase gamma subunit
MDNWTFGFTMIVVGMGGTIVTLGLFALMMGLLKKLFPVPAEEQPPETVPAEEIAPEEVEEPENTCDDEAAPC